MNLRAFFALVTFFILGCGPRQGSNGSADLTPSTTKNANVDGEVPESNAAPDTGLEYFERQKAPARVGLFGLEPLPGGLIFYVYSVRLNVRSSPEISPNNLMGALELNDQVRVLDEVQGTDFVQIQILRTNAKMAYSEMYFVSKKYLIPQQNTTPEAEANQRYFVIQNVATERLRVYERKCVDDQCEHQMVVEASIAVGEKTRSRDRMTVLGSFNIVKWTKFYQDAAGLYPSWYDPNYPKVPKPHASVLAWTNPRVLPYKGAKVRGAFGWYTAFVGPNPRSQWTHGTLGWGADKTKYVDATRSALANFFSDPRSHGCTRTDNEAIAYLRQLLPPGTPLLKIYAKEALADASLSRYQRAEESWDYILTKQGVRVDGERADRSEVIANGTPNSEWLEEGTYKVDVHPDTKSFSPGSKGAKKGENGNVYGLQDSDMKGVYYIDTGKLEGYEHPRSLEVGGYGRNSFPSFVILDQTFKTSAER